MVIVRKQIMLGDKLVQEGIITQAELDKALAEQKRLKEKLGETLVKLGYITNDEILPILASHIGVGSIRIDRDELNGKLVELVSEDYMRKNLILPIRKENNKLLVAMADPTNVFMIDEIQLRTKQVIKPVLAMKNEIEDALEYLEQSKSNETAKNVDSILAELENGDDHIDDDIEDLESGLSSQSAPIIRVVNAIISKAVRMGASDIHIEPYQKVVRVRVRVDGVLAEIKEIPKNVLNAIVSRVKIMSDLDIAEKRLPQDGRFRIKSGGRDIDFRVSTLPTVYGEKIVMRILDKGNLKMELKELGYNEEELTKIYKGISMPYGMILVTGPTGSGKSTTLYSCLNHINTIDKNISTAEDPVEYELQGINQVHCKQEIGLDFATALRSFLRQDPDIIMLGEIRDKETAEICIKAALTGHLVLSTLHTNDAPGAVHRLINMGVEPFMISASLVMVIAQRLARTICPYCKEEKEYDIKTFQALDLDYEIYKNKKYYIGKGCPKCNGTGYKGRTGIYEIMEIDEGLRDLISKGVNTSILANKAIENGMSTLRMQALQKAEKGIISLEEVLRVTIG
jgi:type IV pilus assembly protein PilB